MSNIAQGHTYLSEVVRYFQLFFSNKKFLDVDHFFEESFNYRVIQKLFFDTLFGRKIGQGVILYMLENLGLPIELGPLVTLFIHLVDVAYPLVHSCIKVLVYSFV